MLTLMEKKNADNLRKSNSAGILSIRDSIQLRESERLASFSSSSSSSSSSTRGIPIILWEGCIVWKIPFNGKSIPELRQVAIKRASRPGPHAIPVHVVDASGETVIPIAYISSPPTLTWHNPNKSGEYRNARELILSDDAHLLRGRETAAFQKLQRRGIKLPPDENSFSVISAARTLDIATDTDDSARNLYDAIEVIIMIMQDCGLHTMSASASDSEQFDGDESHLPMPLPIPSQSPQQKGLGGGLFGRSNRLTGSNAPIVPSIPSPEHGSGYSPENYLNYDSQQQQQQFDVNKTMSMAMGLPPPPPLTDLPSDYNNAQQMNYTSNHNQNTYEQPDIHMSELNAHLFSACEQGDVATVTTLLQTGADVNVIDESTYDTPLIIACRSGFPKLAQVCLDFGGKNDPYNGSYGQTALHEAVGSEKHECCCVLLDTAAQSGADHVIANLPDSSGCTPLHTACSLDLTEIAELLLGHGADVFIKDTQGSSVIHFCAFHGQKASLALMLDHGADTLIDTVDKSGNTPLHLASYNGHLSCVRLLVETAADVMARNHDSSTAYDLASSQGHHQVGLLLLEYQEHHQSAVKVSKSLPVSFQVTDKVLGRDGDQKISSLDISPMIARAPSSSVDLSGDFTVEVRQVQAYEELENVQGNRSTKMNMNMSPSIKSSRKGANASPLPRPHTSPMAPGATTPSKRTVFSPPTTPNTYRVVSDRRSESRIRTHSLSSSSQGLSPVPATVHGYGNRRDHVHSIGDTQDSEREIQYANDGYHEMHARYDDLVTVETDATSTHLYEQHQQHHQQYDYDSLAYSNQHSSLGNLPPVPEAHDPSTTPVQKNLHQLFTSSADKRQLGQEHGQYYENNSDLRDDDHLHHYDEQGQYYDYGGYDESTIPAETFNLDGVEWCSFYTTDGHQYFIQYPSGESQWNDPRWRDDGEYDGGGRDEMYIEHENMDSAPPPPPLDTTPSVRVRSTPRSKWSNSNYNNQNSNTMNPGIKSKINQLEKSKMSNHIPPATSTKRVSITLNNQFEVEEKHDHAESKVSLSDSHLRDRDGYTSAKRTPKENKSSKDKSKQKEIRVSAKDIVKYTDMIKAGSTLRQTRRQMELDGATKEAVMLLVRLSDSLEIERHESKDECAPSKECKDNSNVVVSVSADENKIGITESKSAAKLLSTSDDSSSSCVPPPPPPPPPSMLSIELKKESLSSPMNIAAAAAAAAMTSRLCTPITSDIDDSENKVIGTPSTKAKEEITKIEMNSSITCDSQDNKVAVIQKESIDDLKKDAICGPFARMLSVGVPQEAVLQKMAIQGVDETGIMRMKMCLGLVTSSVTSKKSSNVPNDLDGSVVNETSSSAAIKDDPKYTKYFKMASFGIPPGAVESKMKMDEIPANEVEAVIQVMLGVDDRESSNDDVSSNNGGSDDASNTRRPSVPLQKVHWNTLPAEKLTNSIWANNDSSPKHAIKDMDLEEIEKLFKANPDKGKAAAKERKVPTQLQLKFLDGKRAQNVTIGLAQYKVFKEDDEGYSRLFAAVCSHACYSNEPDLTQDHLENLENLLPSDIEQQAINRLTNPKTKKLSEFPHQAEKFLVESSTYLPELRSRLRCTIIASSFGSSCLKLNESISTLLDVCNLILSSDQLSRIMQKMLAVGNIMNQGTHRGQATGFTLDSLMKMVNTKGVDKKTSILDYVVKSTIEKGDEQLLMLDDDLLLIQKHVKLSSKDLSVEVGMMDRDNRLMEKELKNTGELVAKSGHSEGEERCKMAEQYCISLKEEMDSFSEDYSELTRLNQIRARKSTAIMEYFGEDPEVCDTPNIFSVLTSFYTSIIKSREKMKNIVG